MSKRTPMARRFIAAMLMVLLTACQTWRPTGVGPQTYIPAEQPSSVRVTPRIGTTVTLEAPTVRGDSIFGITDAGVVGVASEDVYLLEVRRFSILRSIGLFYLIAGAIIGVLAVACAIGGDDSCGDT